MPRQQKHDPVVNLFTPLGSKLIHVSENVRDFFNCISNFIDIYIYVGFINLPIVTKKVFYFYLYYRKTKLENGVHSSLRKVLKLSITNCSLLLIIQGMNLFLTFPVSIKRIIPMRTLFVSKMIMQNIHEGLFKSNNDLKLYSELCT